jgi:hypothetical protein
MINELTLKLASPRCALVAAGILAATTAAHGQTPPGPVPDTFTAVTRGMTPDGATLKMDVREWSDESRRAQIVAALADGTDVRAALIEEPTIGYVWVSGSSVGYSIKYAHREPTDGGERVTLVTDRPLGAYSFNGWNVPGSRATSELDYSVIELFVPDDGDGTGTISLAVDPTFDEDRVLLGDGSAASVLTGVRLEPKPYWAEDAVPGGG